MFGKLLRERIGERFSVLPAAALLFWFFSYIVMSLRGVALDDPLPVLSIRRVVSTLSGALLFIGAAIILLRIPLSTLPIRIARLAVASVIATAGLFAIQSAAERIFEWSPPITASGQLGWLLMWTGYFAAWLTVTVALLRAREGEKVNAEVRAAAAEAQSEQPAEALWVQRNRETVRVPIRDIEWVEAEGNYARIHAEGQSGLVRASLRSLQGQLGPAGFLRVHRSALCRRDRIRSVRRSGTAMRVVLDSGSEVAVGRAYAAELSSELNL